MRFTSIVPLRSARRHGGLSGGIEEHALTAASELQAAIEGLRKAERAAKDPKSASDCLGAMRAYFAARSQGNRALTHMAEVEEEHTTMATGDREKATSMRAALDLERLAEEAQSASRAAKAATEKCLEALARGQMKQRYGVTEEAETETRATVSVRRKVADI